MQTPITVGTILQNRYRIIHILGQGGFGRTYLAEDQRRFNELCAIKELMLTATGVHGGKKAQELFEREAATLYQIEHPQIPKFREKFEQDQRFFLVQDYVAGKTYQMLLAERQAVGQTFTEAEVLSLLNSLLPVLAHLHGLGIVHRDISPDNLILRDSDTKPVLIDFGVVKELATRLHSPNKTSETTVGKLGYSPSEQMQSGRAYPNSDLYALAVTAIVLLTGKEPADLFDETQLTWNWQQWVQVKPQFAEVLQRMLSYIPGDRYQSAAQVQSALSSLNQPHIPQPNISRMQTVAVGRRPDPIPRPSNKPAPVISPNQTSSILDSPLAIGAIGSAVVILAGFGSWAVVNSIRNPSKTPPEAIQTPQDFPSPVITGGTIFAPTPTPIPTNTQPAVFNNSLNLDSSNPAREQGSLQENQIIKYSFAGEAGQILSLSVDPRSSILLSVLAPNGQPIDNSDQQVLQNAGKYTIQLSLAEGITFSDYTLIVALENPIKLTPTETPTPTPTETPTPAPTETPTPAPTETPTPAPTETPTPTPTETPTPTPTAATGENNQLPETTPTP
ncbi:serine/threonine-protein kinase [Anabaena sp. PCC 7108]|uniref:serine/threonine-protein kinase n=1 Tax=Anabaena sp. PCC 7108 TaxID=163908 RepID=UPI00034C8A48|nr:serine/threonine-protein kinase [Anabaena sp. PCC 7108]